MWNGGGGAGSSAGRSANDPNWLPSFIAELMTSGRCRKCVWVYLVFRVIGNLETGNPETGVSRGSAQNCLPTDRQRLRV